MAHPVILPGNAIEVSMIYGTAWKGERTADCVTKALEAGFRCIDTAAQPKHYREDLVGDAVRSCIESGLVHRKDIYLQIKFTPPSGQDLSNCPYDSSSSITGQVRASVSSSLFNLRPYQSANPSLETYIDCIILHAPLSTLASTLEAWEALSAFVPSSVRALGVSNVTLRVLDALCRRAVLKVSVVQNRFHAATDYDSPLRAFCKEKNIVYEGFSVLTANPSLLASHSVIDFAQKIGVSNQAALYAMVGALENIVVLNGTKDELRMREDIDGIEKLRVWAASSYTKEEWTNMLQEFKRLVGV